MSDTGPKKRIRERLAAWRWPLAILVLVVVAGAGVRFLQLRHKAMETRLFSTPPEEIARHKDLVKFAAREARPLFMKHCAECHGADLKGKGGSGTPNLTDHVWLYGGGVHRIERDILYGLRSGQQRANDLAEMPGFGLRGQMTEPEIRSVVQYVIRLSGREAPSDAAELGRQLYFSHACDDCHSADGKGNIDYGATDFTANVWDYGGDAQSLYESVYYGRHGAMPAFINKLTPAQIRALAIYVHTQSKR